MNTKENEGKRVEMGRGRIRGMRHMYVESEGRGVDMWKGGRRIDMWEGRGEGYGSGKGGEMSMYVEKEG